MKVFSTMRKISEYTLVMRREKFDLHKVSTHRSACAVRGRETKDVDYEFPFPFIDLFFSAEFHSVDGNSVCTSGLNTGKSWLNP